MDGKLHGNKICCDKGRSPGDSFTVQRNLRLVYSPFISKRDVYLSVYLKATSSCRIAIIFNHDVHYCFLEGRLTEEMAEIVAKTIQFQK